MSSSQKELVLNSKTIMSMMRYFGIHEDNDGHILNHLLELNHRCISLILEEAKSCARLSNKDKIDISDVRVAILKKMDLITPRSSPHGNTGQDAHIIEKSDTELINEEFYNKILAQFDQKSDVILPEITDLDIEEVIRSMKDNQDVTTDKFDVDSLLNDPHSL
ncbi:uncharacterized protein LOC132953636 [Metopolophium dirhodum]|uniref:uncharacterized protein LOC132953636 n=1 Tax=Metopolophium dirhodum TaxID=44670 RepID=UPI00298F77CC|nr:uncharacterized protein LOC132953636 [Metopolophium dirhodum]